MSKKEKIVNTLIMNIPICLAICLTAQLLGTGKISLKLTVINYCIAYVLSFVVGTCIPLVEWGIKFALKCKAKPDTLKFGLLINAVVNLGYVIANSLVLTYFNVIILGHAPIIAYFMGMLTGFIPIYIVGYIVSFLWNKPTEKLTAKICGR